MIETNCYTRQDSKGELIPLLEEVFVTIIVGGRKAIGLQPFSNKKNPLMYSVKGKLE